MLYARSLAMMLCTWFLPSACFSSHVCETERMPEGGKAPTSTT